MPDEITPETPAPADYTAKLLALLGLSAEADEAAIDAKIADLQAALGETATAKTSLETATAELEKIRGEYSQLFEREQAAVKARAEAEADEVLAGFADRELTDELRGVVRSMLLNGDRQTAVLILNGTAKRPAAQPAGDQPPAPMHDPAKQQPGEPSEEEIAVKIKARAEELRAANPKLTRTEALTTAERQIRNGQ